MKNSIILVFLFAIGLWSCEETLTMTPEASITFENAFQTESDMETAMYTAESSIRTIVKNSANSSRRGEYDDYRGNGTAPSMFRPAFLNAYTFTWAQEYSALTVVNMPIPFLDDIPMPEERRDFYWGQIHFYKAFIYLRLVRDFGDCMFIRDDVIPGPLARTSWVEIIDYAIAEAREAVRLLPKFVDVRDADGNAMSYRSVPSKGAANAVLAHLCAWKAGCKYLANPADADYDEQALWAAVDSACTAIIEHDESYALAADPETVCTSVLAGGDRESIFESIYRGLGNEVSNSALSALKMPYEWQGYPICSHTMELRGTYRMLVSTVREMFPTRVENGEEITDLRRDAYFYKLDSLAHDTLLPVTEGYAYPWKWRYAVLETEGYFVGMFRGFDHNKIWFRLADIILLRAESRVRMGNTDGAIADLNTIRGRAKAKLYDPTEYEGDLRYAVFKEREKELLMEDCRWYDVLRNDYHATELYGEYRNFTRQDMLDGCFFLIVNGEGNNTLFKQYPFWQKYM